MGLDLSKLARVARTREVVLSMGEEVVRVKVRGLSAAESALVLFAIAEPVPPKKKDPNAGSLSEIPDKDDPGYRRELTAYYAKVRAAEVAVATEATLKDGTAFPERPEDVPAWIEKAAKEVAARFSVCEIENMAAAMLAVSGFETLKAMAHQLVVKKVVRSEEELGEPEDPLELPEDWGRSDVGLMMRASKEYGQDPFKWPLSLSADERNKVLAEQLISDRERAETKVHLQILARALGGMGAGSDDV